MRRFSLVLGALFALAPLAACNILSSDGGIHYDLQPEEYAQDFGGQMGTVPDVPCTSDTVCQQIPAPQGATAVCDTSVGKCALQVDLLLTQAVDLAQEKDFPSSIANSSAVDHVTIDAIHYWTPTNTLSFDTPPIDLYVGSQSAQKETDPGVTKVGTVPTLPAGMRTACGAGAPGTADSRCDLPLTEAGQTALAGFAKDYRTPFNVLVVAHATMKAGDPVPAGKLDLFVQPSLTFHVISSK